MLPERKIAFVLIAWLIQVPFKLIGQVHLQSGAAQMSIPFFQYEDPANRLLLKGTLMYTGGNGLKVNDVASAIGTGWSLDATGVITRIQNGEPDDQKQNGSFPFPYTNSTNLADWTNYVNNYYPNGYLYSEFNTGQPVDNGGAYTPLYPPNYTAGYRQLPIYLADREQDQFSYSFNGRQEDFVIGKNGVVRTMVDSKLKITTVSTDMTSENIITRISSFQVIDEAGIKYLFKDLELSELLEYNNVYPTTLGINNSNYTYGKIVPTPKGKFIVSRWFLSEIINPLTGIMIRYNYENYNMDMPGEKSGYQSYSEGKTHLSLTLGRSKGISKRILNIKCSNADEIEFVYSAGFRKDLPFDKTIDEIRIKYNGEPKYSWKMSYAYFVKNQTKPVNAVFTDAEKRQARLCLLTVQKFGQNAVFEPPYSFEYYNNSYSYVSNGYLITSPIEVVPLFSLYKDHWNYPSRSRKPLNENYLNEPSFDIDYANINWSTLSSITQSKLDARDPIGMDAIAGVLKSVKYPPGGSLSFEYDLNSVAGPSSSVILTGGVRVSKTLVFDGLDHARDIVHEYKYIRTDMLSSGWGYEPKVYEKSRVQRFYNCGNGHRPAKMAATIASYIPGLLHKNVIHLVAAGGIDYGVGIRQQTINNLIVTIVMYIIYAIFTSDYHDYTTYEWSTFARSEANAIPIQYSRVEVIKKFNAGNLGKTVFEFMSDLDYPVDVPVLIVDGSKRPRYAHWAYGLPKSVSVYDNTSRLLSRTVNTYKVFKNILNDNNFVSQRWVPNRTTYNCSFLPPTGQPSNHIDYDIYYPIYGRTELSQTKKYTYNSSNEPSLTTIDYEYSLQNYKVNKIRTTNSKGELIELLTWYPLDYTLPGPLQIMKDNNLVNMPVSSQTLITKSGNQKYLMNAGVSEFGVAPNGDIRIIKAYSAKMIDPVLASLAAFNPAQLIPNSTYYTEVLNTFYNNSGMPVQTNADGRRFAGIYDYNNKLSVAACTNADINNIAYTSFEADGNGGWTFDPLKVSEEFSITGRRCLKASLRDGGTTISRIINNPKTYILSFWKKGDMPVMSGATFSLKKTFLNSASGYTYYEYEVTGATTISLTNRTGQDRLFVYYSYTLDEIRLYPVEARMTTTTYNPLIGKTAECDENGRIIYYEYDDLGRLKLLRDQDRNVVKTFEYNYKQ